MLEISMPEYSSRSQYPKAEVEDEELALAEEVLENETRLINLVRRERFGHSGNEIIR